MEIDRSLTLCLIGRHAVTIEWPQTPISAAEANAGWDHESQLT